MGKVLTDESIPPGEGILHHDEGVDLMPSSIRLSGMEVSLVNAMSRETILRQYLDTVWKQYNHILIDCRPSLSMLNFQDIAVKPLLGHTFPGGDITRQQIGTVERAIKIFLQLGLMEQMPDGAFYMTNIELLIGQSSTEGERKRRARQANRLALNSGGQMSAHYPDIRPPEIEKEKELEKKIERVRKGTRRARRFRTLWRPGACQEELPSRPNTASHRSHTAGWHTRQ